MFEYYTKIVDVLMQIFISVLSCNSGLECLRAEDEILYVDLVTISHSGNGSSAGTQFIKKDAAYHSSRISSGPLLDLRKMQ